jgi:hypothetical protein
MNQKGFITLDFLFAFIICFSLSAVVFAFAITLSVVEIGQYIVFAASRAHSAAHISPEEQAQLARSKYASLLQDRVIKPIFSNGWFSLSSPAQLEIRQGNGSNFEADYPTSGDLPNRKIFQGVRATFNAKMLYMQLPFIGSTSDDERGFTSRIAAVLLRNPSQVECQTFMEARIDAIWNLEGGRANRFKSSSSQLIPQEDNGC